MAETFEYRLALPGYEFSFPRDHGAHPDYRTEWWYFTGHLEAETGRRWGYELTFFRFGLRDRTGSANSSKWSARDLYFAHFAITDITRKEFRFFERRARTGVGIAGTKESPFRIWIEDWRAENTKDGFQLKAAEPDGPSIELKLEAKKSPVIHGRQAISQKSDGKGQASHYYSLTRMNTTGKLVLSGKQFTVTGLTWMDHEFGSNQMSKEQVGWDWFSIQLDDYTELMLYQMRRADGKPDSHSSGTLVFKDGKDQHLDHDDFEIVSTGKWQSPKSGGQYPMGWKVSVPNSGLSLTITPNLVDQELITSESTQVTYWEGSVTINGLRDGKPISGSGYVELAGYAGSLQGKF